MTSRPTAAATPRPTADATATPRPTATAAPQPAATSTPQPTATNTPQPTATNTPQPTATNTPQPTAASDGYFPAKSYGTFFRDQYGDNSEITASEDGGILIDTGSTRYGVALLRVDSIPASKRCKAIVLANKSSYQYDIVARNTYLGIPLQLGNGTYTLTVYEQVEGTSYTPKMSHSFSVSLQSSLRPFTASSIMSDFSRGSGCVSKARSLCSGIDTQDGKVSAVYSWIVSNIAYDRALASSITKQQIDVYLPDPDRTYSSRKGICYDYASLMCAMLRSQGIPTRLIKGSTPLGYHAWNEVFFEGRGWVVVAAFRWKEIDGAGWVMLDSTFAASGMSPEKILSITHTKQKTY